MNYSCVLLLADALGRAAKRPDRARSLAIGELTFTGT